MERSAGILLPIFSLPGAYGIGTLGEEARAFARFLHAAGQTWWQILPVGPVGGGNSPYTSASTFAGNPLLIDPELLASEGLLDAEELRAARLPQDGEVHYEALRVTRETLLRKAYRRARDRGDDSAMRFAERHRWVRDYALFMAAKAHFHGAPWYRWPHEGLRHHRADAVALWSEKLAEEIDFHCHVQCWFFRQWAEWKTYVNALGIKIIGDLPIYVSLDSADVWAEREQFLLDEEGMPTRVAGVPPDYFSEDGQLWGNPLYDWDAMRKDGFGWWIRRVDGAVQLFDTLRIDHFRGLESYWSIPADSRTAKVGRWEKGPGMELLRVLTEWFRDAGTTYIAEDLGLLTEEVHQLRRASGLPGMKVLQFAFDQPGNVYLPHHYTENCICYTGTHDNNTLLGWYEGSDAQERDFVEAYLGARGAKNAAGAVLACGQRSVASLFIAQMQDYLGLGAEARINVPGVAEGNWKWRMLPGAVDEALARRIRALTGTFGRCRETP